MKRLLILLGLITIPFISFTQNKNDKIKTIDSLNSLAANYYHNPDSVILLLTEAESLALNIQDTLKQAEIWARYGRFFYSMGQYRKSIEYSKRAKLAFFTIGDSARGAWSGYFIGLAYKYWGKYREALQEIQSDIQLFERLKDKDGVSNCYIVAGYINQAWHNFIEAERICRVTLKMSQQLGNNGGVGFSQLAIGNSFSSRSQNDSAYHYFHKALAVFKGENDNYGISLAYRDIGSFYVHKNEIAKAFGYYQKSLSLLKKMSNSRGISELYALMGEAYLVQKDYEKALKYLKESQDIAISMELNEDIIKNYQNISIAYEEWGKKDIALYYHKKYSTLKDSIFNEEKHFQIAELQTLYETEKKEQQIAINNIQIEKYQSVSLLQRYLIAAFVLAFILASGIALLALKWYKIKKSDNKLLSEQKQIIEFKNTQITDSINYARRIQSALLGRSIENTGRIKEHFIFYRPKDIVSGDFYYIKDAGDFTVIAASDCTGHGVPGAFMSMLGMTLLNEIFSHSQPTSASEILEQLRVKVKQALNQTIYHSDTRDGMDIALCLVEKNSNQIQYAGAYQPLIQIRNGEIVEFKGTRCPVGVHIKEFPFENHIIETQPNDVFFIFSDGYADQVGGISKQKFKVSEFKKLLLEFHNNPFVHIPTNLESRIDSWRMGNDQTDDMLVIGFKM